MLNPRTKLLTSHPLAVAARAGVLIDIGRFSVKNGSICLVTLAEIPGCRALPEGKTFRYSARGTLLALKLGIDHVVVKTELCWKVLAWYKTFDTGDRVLREKLFLEIKNA
jgi:hypothetical protein